MMVQSSAQLPGGLPSDCRPRRPFRSITFPVSPAGPAGSFAARSRRSWPPARGSRRCSPPRPRGRRPSATTATTPGSGSPGNGAGGFGAKTDFVAGTSTNWVSIGDLNGDGKPDLAVANYGANTVSVLLGNGAGGFGAKTDI